MKTRIAFAFATVLLLASFACKKDEPTKSTPLNVSGTWTGIGLTTDNKTVSFEISISHSGSTITGSGFSQISGSLVKTNFSVSGTMNDPNISLTFKEVLVFFDGTASATSMSGELSGVPVQKRATTFTKK
ncbi:hypothetical protein HUU05_08360 [candidate division KSB1 bacterium]|nr:hypothetical protein [candidate division KSB1 bacterium]